MALTLCQKCGLCETCTSRTFTSGARVSDLWAGDCVTFLLIVSRRLSSPTDMVLIDSSTRSVAAHALLTGCSRCSRRSWRWRRSPSSSLQNAESMPLRDRTTSAARSPTCRAAYADLARQVARVRAKAIAVEGKIAGPPAGSVEPGSIRPAARRRPRARHLIEAARGSSVEAHDELLNPETLDRTGFATPRACHRCGRRPINAF